jgi:NADPH:quinone reductase
LRAICVTSDRSLEVRDVPSPEAPPSGHVIVKMDASAINHGDKTFLARPGAAGAALVGSGHNIWGASGAGTVIAVGAGVPAGVQGKQVAIYRSLSRSAETVGLWSEFAQVLYTSCLVLPDAVSARDYCGSLVNVFTAHAFLEEIIAAGHKGIIVTAGNSATGSGLAALAQRRNIAVIPLVRSVAARDELSGHGVKNLISVTDDNFESAVGALASQLGTTAVFDGVGGELISRLAPVLPMNSTVSFYGLLSGAVPISLPSVLFITKNLTLRRFSNFESATARDQQSLLIALTELRSVIADPIFRTRIGREFSFDRIGEAMAYEAQPGAKAVLVG